MLAPGIGIGGGNADTAAVTPRSVRSRTAPAVADTVMSSPLNEPPSTGVKTVYAVPVLSVMEVGITPAGLTGSGLGVASAGARETLIVNVAMHGARSAAVISVAPSWWLRQMPSG